MRALTKLELLLGGLALVGLIVGVIFYMGKSAAEREAKFSEMIATLDTRIKADDDKMATQDKNISSLADQIGKLQEYLKQKDAEEAQEKQTLLNDIAQANLAVQAIASKPPASVASDLGAYTRTNVQTNPAGDLTLNLDAAKKLDQATVQLASCQKQFEDQTNVLNSCDQKADGLNQEVGALTEQLGDLQTKLTAAQDKIEATNQKAGVQVKQAKGTFLGRVWNKVKFPAGIVLGIAGARAIGL